MSGLSSVVISLVFLCLAHGGTAEPPSVNVTFYPPEIRDLVEKTVRNITVQLSWDANDFQQLKMTARSEDPDSVKVNGNATFLLDYSDVGNNATVLQVEGVFLNKTGITLTFESTDGNATTSEAKTVRYHIGVIRPPSILDTIFIVGVSTMVALNTIGFGCKLDLEVVKKILKKPIAPLVGFCCQYTIMPLTAYALTKIVGIQKELAFGLFVIGVSPGGGGSNVWTVLLDGDLDLSITMTFFSVVASLGMLPLWTYTLGVTLVDADVKIPFQNIAISLVTLVVPCVVGILINRFLPKVSKVLGKLVKPFSLVIILFIVTFGTYANFYIFLMLDDWRLCVGALFLPYIGMLLSGLIAFITRRPWKRIKTIMFETAIQNTGIAILIAKMSLPQPEADLAAVMPVTVAMFTPWPMVVWYVGLIVKNKFFTKGEVVFEIEINNDDENEDEKKIEDGAGDRELGNVNLSFKADEKDKK